MFKLNSYHSINESYTKLDSLSIMTNTQLIRSESPASNHLIVKNINTTSAS